MTTPELRHADFRRIDLNLLVAFDALMQERHVGKAAARVFIGQPAMSHVLGRLREAFDDDLFVRAGHRMEPTALAQRLAPSVRAWLEQANGFLFPRGAFDLAQVQSTIRVATVDGVEPVLLPPLMATLRAAAPGIRIWTKQLQRDEVLAALDAEEVEVAISAGPLEYREWHVHESIARTRFECVYSPAQLTLPDVVTPADLVAYEHVGLSWRGEQRSEIDLYLEAMNLKRHIAVSAVSQLAIMRILQQFPMVTMQTCMMTSIYQDVPGIALRRIEAEGLELDIRLIWHRRNDRDPAQSFVRRQIMALLAKAASRAQRGRAGC